MHPTWAGDLFHPRLYTCFDAVFSKHPTLAFSQSPKVVLYGTQSFEGTSQLCCSPWGLKEPDMTKKLNNKPAMSPLIWQSDKAIIFYFTQTQSPKFDSVSRYSMRLDLASGLLRKCHHRYIHTQRLGWGGESVRHKERAMYMKMQLEPRAISQEKIPMRKPVSEETHAFSAKRSSAACLGGQVCA